MSATTIPTREEVLQQLKKLLASQELESKLVLRSLLEYIVRYSLDGEEKGGKEIAVVVFPASDPDSSNVKANIFWVRQELGTYYSGPGSRDYVLIDLPIGRTYKATFAYRYNADAIRLYERGVSLMGGDGHSARLQAKQCFDLAIREENRFAAAHLAKFQVTICNVLLDHAFAVGRLDAFPVPRQRLEGEREVLELNPDSWLAWCLHGIARLIGREPERARQAFDKALSLNREKTRAHIGYAFYLLLTGEREEALQISGTWEPTLDERLLVARGLFLYLAGQRDAAIEALRSARVSAPEMVTINLLLQGLANLNSGRHNNDTGLEFVFKATSHWIDAQNGSDNHEDYGRFLDGRYHGRYLEGRFWVGYQFPELFPGFNILTLTKVAGPNGEERAEALELLKQLEERSSARPFQLAIACMAVGRKQESVAHLRQAIRDGDILALQIDQWPFLAELADDPDFEGLRKTLRRGMCDALLASAPLRA